MKCLICHDSMIYESEQGKYFKTTTNEKIYSRYFGITDEITLILRTKKLEQNTKKKLNQVNLDNIDVVSCPDLMTLHGLVKYYSEAKKIIENEVMDTDFLVLKAPGFYANIAGKYARKTGKPYLVEIGGCAWDAHWFHSLKGKITAPFYYLATKKLIKYSSHTIYVTKTFLQNRYPCSGKSINCSNVELSDFNERTLRERLNKIKRLTPNSKLVIGTIGPIDIRYKGQGNVIRALGKLKNRTPYEFEYHLVGSGDQTRLMSIAQKYGIEDHIHFKGTLPHDKIIDWLDNIDVYIQPSDTEGLPRALIEAMSRAVPSLGSNAGGIPELLDKKAIFRRKNPKDIMKILQNLDVDYLKKQATNNYKVSKEYNSDLINKRRQSFYSQFAEDSFS